MKVLLEGHGYEEAIVDSVEGSITIPDKSNLYLKFRRVDSGFLIRHSGELVLRDGWICLDYDHDGFLIGMEINTGDPFKNASIDKMEYLQPKNPLGRKVCG